MPGPSSTLTTKPSTLLSLVDSPMLLSTRELVVVVPLIPQPLTLPRKLQWSPMSLRPTQMLFQLCSTSHLLAAARWSSGTRELSCARPSPSLRSSSESANRSQPITGALALPLTLQSLVCSLALAIPTELAPPFSHEQHGSHRAFYVLSTVIKLLV